MFKVKVFNQKTKQSFVHDRITEKDLKWIKTNPNLQVSIVKQYNKFKENNLGDKDAR